MFENVHSDHVPAVARGVNDSYDAEHFDYESLLPEDAQAVRTARARIRIPIKQTTTALITIGVELRVVKKILGHGLEYWVRYDCPFSIRAAQNYMKLARLADKNASVALLPVGTAYRLSGKRVSRRLFDDVVERASSGEPITEGKFERMYKARSKRSSKSGHDDKVRRDQRAIDRRAIEETRRTERITMNLRWIVNTSDGMAPPTSFTWKMKVRWKKPCSTCEWRSRPAVQAIATTTRNRLTITFAERSWTICAHGKLSMGDLQPRNRAAWLCNAEQWVSLEDEDKTWIPPILPPVISAIGRR
jgi:hypothetical protein